MKKLKGIHQIIEIKNKHKRKKKDLRCKRSAGLSGDPSTP